jgi:transcriptional regulator with PAS, ATPase and Fis domain
VSTLADVGSTNGTFVNGAPIAGAQPVHIDSATVFQLGLATCVLQPEHVRPGLPAPAAPGSAESPVVADARMRELYALLDVVAPTPLSVLILGETGVGKDVYAETLHRRSARAAMPFARIHCAAIPESMLEGELFGYEKGAFTGAAQAKPGLLEAAVGGTVFLDEIGEVPLPIQAKLLRAIESREVMRLGSLKPMRVDVRFVSATNRDMKRCLTEGSFRADLYYRLNGISVTIPALRDRRADIVPLATIFLQRAAASFGRPARRFTAAGIAHLTGYRWPGNVRELRSVVERAVVLCPEADVDADQLALAEAAPGESTAPASSRPPESLGPETKPVTVPPAASLRDELQSLEKQRIADALARTGGNQSQAAKLLGMSRFTLMSRMEQYGIARPRKKPQP